MIQKTLYILFILLLVISLPSTIFGRSIIKGQVIDAETAEPIKGAAVYIYWGKRGEGPPGLAASSVEVEVAESLTDSKGFFEIPKYSTFSKHYYLAVYKKGYVCWSSEWIFPTWKERKGFKLKNGIMIKLEHYKEEYLREKHADFISSSSSSRKMPGIFSNAIKPEMDYRDKKAKERRAISF